MFDAHSVQQEHGFESPLLTAQEAAGYLRIAPSTLNKLRRGGKISATYVCTDARYLVSELDSYIAKCLKKSKDSL